MKTNQKILTALAALCVASTANAAILTYGTFAGAFDNFTMTTVPEPGTYALLAGLLGLSYVMVRRRQA